MYLVDALDFVVMCLSLGVCIKSFLMLKNLRHVVRLYSVINLHFTCISYSVWYRVPFTITKGRITTVDA